MVPSLFDTIRMLLPGATDAAADAADADAIRLIPETLAMLEGIHNLSDEELRTLAGNLGMLAQCAENRAERRGVFDML